MRALKISLLVLIFCSRSHAHPLFPANIGEEELQQYSQAVQQLRNCISRVDQGEIEELQEKSNTVASQLRYLCFSGKPGQAEAIRQEFYQQVAELDTVKQVKACNDNIPARYDAYMNTPLDLSQFSGEHGGHICDREIMAVDQFNKHSH